jgi:hypothetical protein
MTATDNGTCTDRQPAEAPVAGIGEQQQQKAFPSENTSSEEFPTQTGDDERGAVDSKYPDGGVQAWLVVLGAWCAMIPSMGLLNTIGVLQAWVAQNQLASYSRSDIGWIFSTYAFFLFVSGAQVGRFIKKQICGWGLIMDATLADKLL